MNKLFLAILVLFFSFAASANPTYKNIDGLISQSKLDEAITAADKALKSSPKDVEVIARKARATALKADNVSDEDEKVKILENSQKIAEMAIEANPKSAKGYLRRAVAKGKLILFKGILESRSLVLELKADCEKALELAATDYETALGNYMLGRSHLKLADKPRVLRIPIGLGWASKKTGGEHLKKAYELSPTSISFNIAYAEYLIDQGDKGQAKKILTGIESIPVFDPTDVGHKKRAKELLAGL